MHTAPRSISLRIPLESNLHKRVYSETVVLWLRKVFELEFVPNYLKDFVFGLLNEGINLGNIALIHFRYKSKKLKWYVKKNENIIYITYSSSFNNNRATLRKASASAIFPFHKNIFPSYVTCRRVMSPFCGGHLFFTELLRTIHILGERWWF